MFSSFLESYRHLTNMFIVNFQNYAYILENN